MPADLQQTRSDALRRPSKLSYDQYISSARWERRKAAYYAKHPKKCRVCGSPDRVHLHHHTYKRMGVEHDDDLIPLCKDHHDAVHRLYQSAEFVGTLTAATRSVIGGPLHPRKRKRPDKVERSGRSVRQKVDPAIRKRRYADRMGFGAVKEEFGVSASQLRQQGYRNSVPMSRIEQWRITRPDWMPK